MKNSLPISHTSHSDWLNNEYTLWGEALMKADLDTFKSRPMVRRMLSLDMEGDEWAVRAWSQRMTYTEFDVIATINNIGNYTWKVDPACFRMIYYAQQIMLNPPTAIVEIGGGVGQFYAILRALGYEGKYYIEDLPLVAEFQRKYLAEVTRLTGLNTDQSTATPFKVCSFYAFGEFDDKTKRYYDDLLQTAQTGFIAFNPHSGASDDTSMFPKHAVVAEGLEEGIKTIIW